MIDKEKNGLFPRKIVIALDNVKYIINERDQGLMSCPPSRVRFDHLNSR